jgi:hypothetical protein
MMPESRQRLGKRVSAEMNKQTTTQNPFLNTGLVKTQQYGY